VPSRGVDDRHKCLARATIGPYPGAMRHVLTLLAILVCCAAQGCVTDKKLSPPDHVIDPRG
jgi:hypothetical protein